MNALSNFDKTDVEYSLARTDDLIRFWRSKVKVIAGRRGGKDIPGGKDIRVDAGVSESISWFLCCNPDGLDYIHFYHGIGT